MVVAIIERIKKNNGRCNIFRCLYIARSQTIQTMQVFEISRLPLRWDFSFDSGETALCGSVLSAIPLFAISSVIVLYHIILK